MPTCYACRELAVAECPDCGRPFCALHGSRWCLECLERRSHHTAIPPTSGVPSSTFFWAIIAASILVVLLSILAITKDPTQWGFHVPRTGFFKKPEVQLSPTVVLLGEVVPTPTATTVPSPTPTFTATLSPVKQYTVEPGDNLSSIAEKFGTTVDALVSANNLADRHSLRVGQVLIIPPPEKTP